MDSFSIVLKIIIKLETVKLCIAKIHPHISQCKSEKVLNTSIRLCDERTHSCVSCAFCYSGIKILWGWVFVRLVLFGTGIHLT